MTQAQYEEIREILEQTRGHLGMIDALALRPSVRDEINQAWFGVDAAIELLEASQCAVTTAR